jgi:hypothetical protein
LTAEVKDKLFNPADVEHAIMKARVAGQTKLFFVMGPRASIDELLKVQKRWEEENFFIYFIDVLNLLKITLTIAPEYSISKFFTYIRECSESARVKDDLMVHLKKCLHNQL